MEEKNYYTIDAVSNSSLTAINPHQGGTPARYKKYWIDKERVEEETPSLKNGKLIHLYVEDPEKFIISDVELPTPKLAEWVEEVFDKIDVFTSESFVDEDNEELKRIALTTRTKFGNTTDTDKLWKKFKEGFPYLKYLFNKQGKIVMTPAEKTIVESAITSLKTNSVVSDLLFDTEDFSDIAKNELPIYFDYTVDIDNEKIQLKCKSLLDRVIFKPEEKRAVLIDLKTTSKPGLLFKDSFEKYRYYRQMSFYLLAIQSYIFENYNTADDWTVQVKMVVVETYGTFESFVYNVSNNYIQKGFEEVKGCLSRIAYAKKYNNWTLMPEMVKQQELLLDDKSEEV